MAEKEYKSCSDCIHYDVCYKIEHYGQNPEATALLCKLFIDKNDVAPVKHGYWIDNNSAFECSNCNYQFEHEGYKHFFNYCPCCGAKMDGGDEE